ncbi:MAG: sigma-54 dependent transcriptional regulator [Thermoanaerobaculia bacterium]|nr:sigma-54 dependent transcriptional regulator [Thermoanaerobaculia bacterium]
MPRETVMIVEDEGIVQLHLRRIVEAAGFQVVGLARTGLEALAVAAEHNPDIALLDIRLDGPLDGVETGLQLRAAGDTSIVFVTAHADEATLSRASAALPLGYVVKPFEAEDVRAALVTAAAQRSALSGAFERTPTKDRLLASEPAQKYGMKGESPLFRQLLRQIREVARGPWTVLIQGETGTGKELVAKAIHEASPWRQGPFIPVNCGALSESLASSQLFGHRQGAFTGAVRDHRGFFESAHGGTLFLDEVAELPLSIQASLLRILEDRRVQPLGSALTRKLDFRLLAATHQDLAGQVRDQKFRQDLFYRLRVARVTVPPLRQRPEDIPCLTRHFLAELADLQPVRGVSAAALRCLESYPWPGNIRELRSAIEFAAIRCPGDRLGPADLPPEIGGAVIRPERGEELDLAEALRQADGNHSQAARLLGISRATYYRRIGRRSQPQAN